MERLQTDGKFFRAGQNRVHLRAVTYGPFPGGWPQEFEPDFARISAAGFNSLRLYQMPPPALLDAALRRGLRVFAGLRWASSMDFFRHPEYLAVARVALAEGLRDISGHPALAGLYVGNEVPADLARWMNPARVREAIEDLIALGRSLAPSILFAYGNYPSTEYLEPENADFTAFNVYLEDAADLRRYVRRLHHVAGDRPVVISEFGLDSQRNGTGCQAELLDRAIRTAVEEQVAGFTVYAWSDRWWNAGAEVTDWSFGLIDREGRDKPAMAAVKAAFQEALPPAPINDRVSVIICTRNGRERIAGCLEAVGRMTDGNFETIVVDDGSDDGTGSLVHASFPNVTLLREAPAGLSAARNAGAHAATGTILAFTDDDCEPDREWVTRLRRAFADGRFAAAGGPNLPPPARDAAEAVVSAAPGAPSHVMLDDEEAEHLPGCNLAVTKAAFEAIGGFDPQFHTAGDDVDFCWRLRDAGYRIGFSPGAFVWHWRRPSLRAFLRQQRGYGKAEKLLLAKHPQRFTATGEARWEGFVYNGGPIRAGEGSIIYHGAMGLAGYQSVVDRMMPLRGIEPRFDTACARAALAVVKWWQPRVRAWERNRVWKWCTTCEGKAGPPKSTREIELWSDKGVSRESVLGYLLAQGWKAAGETDEWDLEKDGSRLLIALETGDGHGNGVLVRVWGDAAPVLRV